MSAAQDRAAKGAKANKRKNHDDRDSKDSDTLRLEIERKEHKLEAERSLQQKQREGEAIQKQ